MAHSNGSAKKSAESILKYYGYEFLQERGRKGGLKKNPNKGFGSDRERAAAAGRKGGARSRRPANKKVIQDGTDERD